MRIVHVSPHLPPDQAANALLPALAGAWSVERGHTVKYIAYPAAQGGQSSVAVAGPVTWMPRRDYAGGLRGLLRLDALAYSRQVAHTLDEVAGDADLLHLHSNGLLIEAAARWASQRGTPYVLTLYGTEIWHYARRWPIDFFRRAYHGAAAVTFYSRGLLDRARELGLTRDALSVVYPAVADAFQPVDDHTRAAWRTALRITEPHVILNVKRLHELAGQTYLLDAFAPIAQTRTDVRLIICGTGALRESLEQQADRLGITARVTFAGLVPNDVVARYTAVADVFALPSLLEALPTVAVEALAAGTPVVSADHPGGVELHGVFGDDVAVVPRKDVTALTRALTAAIEAGRRTRPATVDLLTEHFRPAAVAAQYEALYQRIGAERGR